MSDQRDPDNGVPVWEALERWAPQDLWRRYKEIVEHDPTLQVMAFGPGYDSRSALENEAVDLRSQISRGLANQLASGQLVATGLAMPLKPTTRRRVIERDLWRHLQFTAKFKEVRGDELRVVDLLIRERETASPEDRQEAVPQANRRSELPTAGRPSIMNELEHEMRRRAAANELEPSMRRESEVLVAWATTQSFDRHIPKPASVQKKLASVYQDLKKRNSPDKSPDKPSDKS